jgi:hypothetical protein
MNVYFHREDKIIARPLDRSRFIPIPDELHTRINKQLESQNFSLEAIVSYFTASIDASAKASPNMPTPKGYELLKFFDSDNFLVAAVYESDGKEYLCAPMIFGVGFDGALAHITIDIPFSVPEEMEFDSVSEEGIILKMALVTTDDELSNILEKLKEI